MSVRVVRDSMELEEYFETLLSFSDRVVFKELFLSGLTLLDLNDAESWELTLSNIAAKQELRELLSFLKFHESANSL